jgi:hypothetical protein
MINYDGRKFRAAGGDTAAIAVYHQNDDIVWADVRGGGIRYGTVAGIREADGTLRMGYVIVLAAGEIVCGHTVNTPELLDGGRVQLREVWERYGPDATTGVSYLEEVG